MNSSSARPIFNDNHQRTTDLRSKILKNEEQRIELEQKLRVMSNKYSRSYKKTQIRHIQNYFTRLNQDSQRAEQRNLQLLDELTQAQQHLDKLHYDAEHLIQLKNDYQTYLESIYPNWQKPMSPQTSINIDINSPYDRLVQNIRQSQDHLENDGNLRQSVPLVQQSYDGDSSMLVKRYENQLKVRFDRTTSPSTPIINTEIKDQQQDENSPSESNESVNLFSRAKRNGSLRMGLSCNGLYFLLDYIENEFADSIDKNNFYRVDQPTITLKRNIIDIANDQHKIPLKDHDPTTISMVILDQLPSIMHRSTVNKCLLTEDILSANIQDLDRYRIEQMLPEQDRLLWSKLVDHFGKLLKLHIMDLQTLVNKFTIALLPTNVFYAHDKAKSLLKHVVEKLIRTQSNSSEDESIKNKKQPSIQTNTRSQSSWLKKARNGSAFYDNDEEISSSSTPSTPIPKSNGKKENSDDEYFD